MKVLYIGHYKEASGWGQVAQDYIMALDRVGVDVVPRALRLGNPVAQLPQRLIDLEKKSAHGCDIVIQHVLPHYMKYDSGFKKNIGVFELETNGMKNTSWPAHLNLMDEVWVPCTQMEKECANSGVTKKTLIVPHTFDISVYQQEYEPLDLPLKGGFAFYFIGEFGKRKHLGALIQAFHTTFSTQEPVELVLKVNKFGMDYNALAQEIGGMCNKIKENLRLYRDIARYKRDIVISANMSRTDLLRLHRTCHCFVCPSYGEAWCIPAWEAMAMGNLLISGGTGAMTDYVDAERTGFLVKGTMEPVFGQNETFAEFGTAREQWFNISIDDLGKTMRRVYEMRDDRKQKIKLEAKLSCGRYDYSVVGQQMKELLSV